LAIHVNGVKITDQAVASEVPYHSADSLHVSRDRAARTLVAQELLRQEAHRMAVPAPEIAGSGESEDDARIRALIEREISVPDPDESECRTYFEVHRERFRGPGLYEVSHILIAADPADEEARDAAKTKAMAVIRRLRENPSRFAEIAAEVSDCPSKDTGGTLGQISKGQNVPEFEEVAFRMKEGSLSHHPVETRHGFHILYMDKRIEGALLEFDAVRERIAEELQDRKRHKAISQYLQILVGRSEITGIELEDADALTVR
jgi:peptidyl-prolyl cis-trans isomerase C